MGKPECTDCQHLCEHGCGIYAERPEVCRGFSCLWLLAMSDFPECRPDRLGVLIRQDTKSSIVEAFVATELRPGAFEDHRELLHGLAALSSVPFFVVLTTGENVVLTDSENQLGQLIRDVNWEISDAERETLIGALPTDPVVRRARR